ncbi:ferritin-like domain-containing protein [Microlunatus speluncae]|uniref:ferritin-like domain-containing protein n=1 Tax=Microlunatus speluncae TaxID=2594267 RepID=UPI001FE8D79F|nr:ferritin-like domain-containing protein [Microlunatus speluncae]
MKGAAAVIPGAIAIDMLSAKWAFAEDGDFKGPIDVLNYALTLEYLEAEFYRQGNEAELLSGQAADYLETIQKDEEAHVWALKDTIEKLGETPVGAPKVDFGEAFKSKASYLETAYTFENLGVQAYLGAAPSLFREKELLTAAASIFGVEARHAAIIGVLQKKEAEGGVYQGAFETPASKSKVLKAAGPFIVAEQTL